MPDPRQLYIARQLEQAKLFAKADRSDPFAYARARTHILNGLAMPKQDGSPGGYNADEIHTKHTLVRGDGSILEYTKEDYINRQRP